MLLWITCGHFPRAPKQTNKQSSLILEEVDDHGECDVDEGDEALPTCPSDEDFVLGEIGGSSDQRPQLSESESDS